MRKSYYVVLLVFSVGFLIYTVYRFVRSDTALDKYVDLVRESKDRANAKFMELPREDQKIALCLMEHMGNDGDPAPMLFNSGPGAVSREGIAVWCVINYKQCLEEMKP